MNRPLFSNLILMNRPLFSLFSNQTDEPSPVLLFYERLWSPYGGFALEEDLKTKNRKQCDMLFRILMIMHHTEGAD